MPQVEHHVNAIAFPYKRDGDLVNVKYRDRQKNFRMETGAERVLYALGWRQLFLSLTTIKAFVFPGAHDVVENGVS
jgi:hypothetical protein